MLNRSELNRCREIDIMSCDISDLVDLQDISIDATKSVRDRIDSFLEQVRNPYLFKVDDVIVKVKFGKEKSLSDALTSVLLLG